tara:strand:- start:960 stop:1547 length:588 start_codon:yes stop_codon:yes gene_type:complete
MGSMSSDGDVEGGYGDDDYNSGGSAEVHSSNTGDVDVDTIMRMNREADLADQNDRDEGELNIGATYDEMDGDTKGEMFGVDESEMSDMNYDGKTPLPNDSDFDFSKIAKKLGKLGKGLGGESKSLGRSGPNKNLGDTSGPAGRGFSTEPFGQNPYGSPEVPKRGLKTADYESVFGDVMGLLQRSRIRKPTISSLV